jgi:hypothetical protein
VAPSPSVPVAAVGGGPPRESSIASENSRGRGKRRGPGGNAAGPSRAVKLRKERDPNWAFLEMMTLAAAKRDEFLNELDVVDQRELMDPESSKWERIASRVDATLAGQPHIYRSGPACKYKWQSMLQEYKKLADFHHETGRRQLEYFDLTVQEKLVQKLPRNFYKEVYDCMNEWLQHKPSINLPHARDTLNPSDANYEGRDAPISTHGQFPMNVGS